ncbi:MAG TPA: BadF/BadG/BcrA/BcrD ATPase family protein, partial [Actinomycetes bacterium]|nr:BadF/BadG/BcrA/BcrD ATPase family protein [Actinomycetes bacterium]
MSVALLVFRPVEPELPLVIGVDAGGSHTRVLVASAAGARVAAAASGGGNPTSRGLDATVSSLRAGLESALFGLDRRVIRHAVLGVAGAGPCIGELRAAVRDTWRPLGLDCPFEVVSDLEAAFAAGTHAMDGVVLVAGTGAAAARVRQGRVARVVDGHGWLLGDDGSGFWLGRESLRACLAHLDGRGPQTMLTGPVLRALGVAAPPDEPSAARRIKEAVYRRPPVALAELAPLVTTAAASGDEVAAAIVERAAALLISTAEALLQPGRQGLEGVVLAGGVLLAPGPLSAAVRRGLRDRLGRPPALATDG